MDSIEHVRRGAEAVGFRFKDEGKEDEFLGGKIERVNAGYGVSDVEVCEQMNCTCEARAGESLVDAAKQPGNLVATVAWLAQDRFPTRRLAKKEPRMSQALPRSFLSP